MKTICYVKVNLLCFLSIILWQKQYIIDNQSLMPVKYLPLISSYKKTMLNFKFTIHYVSQ